MAERTETSSEAHRRAARAYQERHRRMGLCVLCPAPAVTRNYCEFHRVAINEWRNQAYRRTRATRGGLERSAPQTYHCSRCGETGHNARTCQRAARASASARRAARTRAYRCSACGQIGHSIRRCPGGRA